MSEKNETTLEPSENPTPTSISQEAAAEADRIKVQARAENPRSQTPAPLTPGQETSQPKRGRGRPKGSKNKKANDSSGSSGSVGQTNADGSTVHTPEEFYAIVEMANVFYSAFGVEVEEKKGKTWSISAARMANKYGGIPFMQELMFLATTAVAFGPPSYIAYMAISKADPKDVMEKLNALGNPPEEPKTTEFKVVGS